MYARGMSVRDIQAHLTEIYGTDISPSLDLDRDPTPWSMRWRSGRRAHRAGVADQSTWTRS